MYAKIQPEHRKLPGNNPMKNFILDSLMWIVSYHYETVLYDIIITIKMKIENYVKKSMYDQYSSTVVCEGWGDASVVE